MNARLKLLRDYFPTAIYTGKALVFISEEWRVGVNGDSRGEGTALDSPERDRAEQRANLVELKVWRELRHCLFGEPVNYLEWWKVMREPRECPR